jgi:Zn finger protein HypA/HybF involved in hydrogenase expression
LNDRVLSVEFYTENTKRLKNDLNVLQKRGKMTKNLYEYYCTKCKTKTIHDDFKLGYLAVECPKCKSGRDIVITKSREIKEGQHD